MKKNQKEFVGILRGNKKGFGFVKIEDRENEIFIPKQNINGAVDGDEVLVKINKQQIKNKKEEGKILKIIKHSKNKIVGTFQNNKSFGFVIPDDKKINADIYISKKNFNKAKNNQKVVVEITQYAKNNKKAEGKIVEILGNINQAGIDMLSLIKEYDLPYEFPDKVIEEAKKIQQNIENNKKNKRLDLRDKIIFTIDGEDAKDLDDAITVEKLKNGNYMLNVSIADVSFYVKENSEINKEALIRGTSIYMLDRVIPMLPKELSNGICSLNQNEDRFAISVLMEIDKNGKIISSDIKKSIIKVTRRMSYKEVQTILNEIEENKEIKEEIISRKEKEKLFKECSRYFQYFHSMYELANILKKKRMNEGGIELNIPETNIILDKNGIAIDVKKSENYFSNQIIEQFMLIANEVVAEKFYWLEVPFIYRVHEEPDMEKVDELNKFLWNLGYKIKTSNGNIHSKSFSQVLEKVKGKSEERVISNLILRTLKIAKYEKENKGHFGLASKYYCHFTSPIRRYPDLFIHRIISICLENNYQLTDKQMEKYDEQALRYAQRSSEREKIAQKVERDACDIKKAEFMEKEVDKEYNGIISNITAFGIFVELPNTIEGLIRFDNLGDEYFVYDENKKTLIGEKTKKTYKIGDKIKIKVISSSKITKQIDFKRV